MLNIIIPCFNHHQYLEKCLQSIKLNISNLSEIIVYVVDDCSKYSTEYLYLIEKYKQYFNCLYLKTEKNSGPGNARNMALKLLKNNQDDFTTFIDDDDIIINDILCLLDNKYDFIITQKNSSDNIIESSKEPCDTLQGIVYNNSFLKRYNLNFPTYMTDGCEDSVFKTITMFLSSNYICKNYQFYQRIYRTNSNFTRSNCIWMEYFYQQKLITIKDQMIWLSCLFYYLDEIKDCCLNNNDIIIKIYFLLFDILFDSEQIIKNNFNLTFQFILIMIYGILKYYNFNLKISSSLLRNDRDIIILEFIELIKNNFKLIDNNIVLIKNNTIKNDLNNSFYLKEYKNLFNSFLELPSTTQYYDIKSMIKLFSHNYYKTQFENIREINNE